MSMEKLGIEVEDKIVTGDPEIVKQAEQQVSNKGEYTFSCRHPADKRKRDTGVEFCSACGQYLNGDF